MADKGLTKEEKKRLKEKEQFERERKKWKQQEAKKRSKKHKKRDSTSAIIKVTAIIAAAAIVISIAAIYGSSYNMPGRFMPALTVGKENISAPVYAFNFYFLYQQMHQYGTYIGLDTTKSVFGQTSMYTKDGSQDGEKLSWEDYLRQQVNTSLQNEFALYGEALKEGMKLDKESTDSIEEQMKTLKDSAVTNAMSVNALLRNNYVAGITENTYQKIQERTLLSNQFAEKKQEEFRANHPDSELQGIYDKDPAAYNQVDYRIYSFAKTAVEEIEGESDADKALRQAKQDEKTMEEAQAFLRSSRTEAAFIAQADKLMQAEHEAEQAEEDDGHTHNADADTLNVRQRHDTISQTYGDEKLADWFYASERKAGDTTAWGTDSHVYAVYLLRPAYAQSTVDFYTINVDIDTSAEVQEGEPTAQETAQKNAEDLLAKWKKDGGTKEAFTALISQQADALQDALEEEEGSEEEETEPGLNEKAAPGDSGVTELDDWVFDAARKEGEATVIETSSSYKVVFISKLNKDDYVYMTEISDNLVEEDYAAYIETLHESYSLGYHGIGMRFALSSAKKMCDAYMEYNLSQQNQYDTY